MHLSSVLSLLICDREGQMIFEDFFPRVWDVLSTEWLQLLKAAGNTFLITIGAFLIGLIIGTLVATLKTMPKNSLILRILDKIASVYLWFFRGTPIVVQLLLFYFVIFVASSDIALVIAIVIFGLNSGAYVTEIMRSGILSVDKGQMEASRSLGLNYRQSMGMAVLPQAAKNALPSLGNELITLFKETSVAGFIAVIDITRAFQLIVGAKYYVAAPYIMLAVFYLIFVSLLTIGLRAIEKKLRKGDAR